MKSFVTVAVAGTIVAVLAGPRGPLGGFWAPAANAPKPEGALLAGFVAEGLVEAIAFGIGMAVLFTGRRWFSERAASGARADTAWLATVWLFASWLPHAALHLHLGAQPAALLAVEWIFHVGAIVAVAALLWGLSGGAGRPASERSAASSGV
jgi:hypothetical protein